MRDEVINLYRLFNYALREHETVWKITLFPQMNTWKRCNKCTPKPLQDVHFFFWPNRMLSDSVIASSPRGGFYYKLGFRCIMYKLSSRYIMWVTDQVFCHWFVASVWSALTVNQWGKWESVTLSMDWEYEASNFFFISEVNWHVGKGEC